MNVFSKILILMFVMSSSSAFSSDGARINISFMSPERFTDFKTQANLRFKDRERLMQQLTKLMVNSATQSIADDAHLDITINNIDMAGSFLYSHSDLYRVVREFDRILINFSYRLSDVNGNVVNQGDVKLTSRDRRPVRRAVGKYKHSNFTHEMPLFDDWLKTL